MSWASTSELASGMLLSMVLAVPRVLVCVFVLPMFPQAMFPTLLRTGIAIGLGAPAAAGVFMQLDGAPTDLPVAALVVKEAVLGLMLGLALSTPFWAMDSVGALTDNQRGANAAQQVTPFARADASPVGTALQQALIVFLASSGAFGLMYRLILLSYEAWPVLGLGPGLAPFDFDAAVAGFSEFAATAALYAAPMLIVGLLVDFTFALIGIFAPELQSYFAAMPMKSLFCLLVLALYLSILLGHGENYFLRVIDRETKMLNSAAAPR